MCVTISAKAYTEPTDPNHAMIEKIALAYGQNPEVAFAIVKCESNYNKSGDNINKDGSVDTGLFQINSIHRKQAKNMGIDINTDRGNIVYAMWLMKNEGTKPWSASRRCWKKLV